MAVSERREGGGALPDIVKKGQGSVQRLRASPWAVVHGGNVMGQVASPGGEGWISGAPPQSRHTVCTCEERRWPSRSCGRELERDRRRVESRFPFASFDFAAKGILIFKETVPQYLTLRWGGTAGRNRNSSPRTRSPVIAGSRFRKQHNGALGTSWRRKPALLAAFGQRLHDQNVPFLAIKADLLDLGISDEEGLSQSIGLDHIPTKLLLGLSLTRPTVLIIDQLDALAGYVDLRTGRLNVLLNLVRRLSGARNIHIVLSARTFEYEHDVRLRTIRAESLNLELPPWSTVLRAAAARWKYSVGSSGDVQIVNFDWQRRGFGTKLLEKRSWPCKVTQA
ncbi:MAG: hypothetical protein EOS85_17235 [Mesorhizobium sp.]|nr:MAG: hypothetical protein EOS85_17235 [Mesorhizobium sp.]